MIGTCYVSKRSGIVSIIRQSIVRLEKTSGQDVLVRGKFTPPKRDDMKNSMEALIHHFKLYTERLSST